MNPQARIKILFRVFRQQFPSPVICMLYPIGYSAWLINSDL